MEPVDRFVYRVRVGYVDTDRAGVVHHAAYLRYLEHARVELLRARGIDYRRFESEERRGIPVAELRVRYRAPAFFDDELEVATWVDEINRAKMTFAYQVSRGDDPILTAEVVCACVDLDAMKLCSVHPRFREVFG